MSCLQRQYPCIPGELMHIVRNVYPKYSMDRDCLLKPHSAELIQGGPQILWDF